MTLAPTLPTKTRTALEKPTHWLDDKYLQHQQHLANTIAQSGAIVKKDTAGNIWGKLYGKTPGKTFVLAAHYHATQDRDPLEALVVLKVLDLLAQNKKNLQHDVEIVILNSDITGNRFGKKITGAFAVTKNWNDDWWSLTDDTNTSLKQAFLQSGLNPDHIHKAERTTDISHWAQIHFNDHEAHYESLNHVSKMYDTSLLIHPTGETDEAEIVNTAAEKLYNTLMESQLENNLIQNLQKNTTMGWQVRTSSALYSDKPVDV